MGYDCTFHLIDEQAIREGFVPKLLGRTDQETAFDRIVENADQLWSEVRQGIEGEDSERACNMITQLAVMFSSCSLPYHYERGFALSLWDRQDAAIAVDFPFSLSSSPQPLFMEIVAAHPRLDGDFPDWFTGNYCTGVFLQANVVPAALEFVEAKVAGFKKGDRRLFKGLLYILRTAVERGLAFWEATDLAIPIEGVYPGDPRLMTAAHLSNLPGQSNPLLERAPTESALSLGPFVSGAYLISSESRPFETTAWDLSAWPPRITLSIPHYSVSVATSRSKRWLLNSESDPEARPRNFRPHLFDPTLSAKPIELPPLPVDASGAPLHIESCGFVDGRSLLIPEFDGDATSPPLWLEDPHWRVAPGFDGAASTLGLRAAEGDADGEGAMGFVDLPEGSLVIWQGDGYELNGEGFRLSFALGALTSHVDWTSVAQSPDRFFYLSNRRLFEARRGSEPERHLPELSNVMFVQPGPRGSLLLIEGDNDEGDTAKLYFPDAARLLSLAPEVFDDREYRFICWSEKADRFIVSYGEEFLALGTDAALERIAS